MYPYPIVSFNLFGIELNVYMYGLLIAIGFIIAFGVLNKYGEKKNIDKDFLDFLFDDGLISIFFGFLSAATFQAFYNFIENPSKGFHISLDNITFIGGILGGAATFLIVYYLFGRKYKNNIMDIISIAPCCILISHGFGRVGCFFAGCCYGLPTDSMLGVKFPEIATKVFPTQLYEAIFLFVMFVICSYLLLKKNYRYNMSLYLVTYGIFRFFIEFLRGDDRGALFGILSPSQFWSLVFIVGGIILYFFIKKYDEKLNQN